MTDEEYHVNKKKRNDWRRQINNVIDKSIVPTRKCWVKLNSIQPDNVGILINNCGSMDNEV